MAVKLSDSEKIKGNKEKVNASLFLVKRIKGKSGLECKMKDLS